jgi:hypothetical protein
MIDTDILRERLRERMTEPSDDYNRGQCQNCLAQLTTTDVEADECSNCHSGLTADDEDLADDYD